MTGGLTAPAADACYSVPESVESQRETHVALGLTFCQALGPFTDSPPGGSGVSPPGYQAWQQACRHGRCLGCTRDYRVHRRDAVAGPWLGAGVKITDLLLLALSIAMFGYLAVALFRAELF